MSANTPEEVHTLFLDAFNRADLDALVALYEPNAVLVTQKNNAVGRGAIRAAYQRIFAEGSRIELTTMSVLDSCNGLALLHAAWTFYRGNRPYSGISTEVVRRQSDGAWLFVLDEPRTPSPPLD